MNILSWFSNHKNDNPSSTSRGREINVKKALTFTKKVEKLRKYYIFLERYIEFLLSSDEEIAIKIKAIKEKTNQNLKDEQLIKELWVLRYAALHVWFFNLKAPKNQDEVKENLALINYTFQNALGNREKTIYLSWFKNGFAEYVGADELNFNNLKSFKTHFPEQLSEKIVQIAFDCTEGRLGGELHDFVIELIMTTFQQDKKAFELDDDVSLTDEEVQSIKNSIDSMKPTEKDFEDFIESLG